MNENDLPTGAAVMSGNFRGEARPIAELKAAVAEGGAEGYTFVRTEHDMRKKLSAVGNSLGIVIEKPILELLEIDRETELEMRTDGERLIIEPIRSSRRAKVTAAVQRAMAAHDSTLRKLAK